MKYLVIIAFLFTSCSITRNGYSQGLHSNSNKAVKAYNQGMEYYDYLDYQNAEILFREAVSSDPKFYEAYMMLGELYTKQKSSPMLLQITSLLLNLTQYLINLFSSVWPMLR